MSFARLLPLILLFSASLVGCAVPSPAEKASDAREIDAAVNSTLSQFYQEVSGAQQLASKAQGILVFPDVYKAGIWVGGEYGRGALRVGGKTVDYYGIGSTSTGLQIGAKARNIVFLFMTPEALTSFQNTPGWQAGASTGVALVETAAESSVQTAPVLAFMFVTTGLMADASVDGAKITRLDL